MAEAARKFDPVEGEQTDSKPAAAFVPADSAEFKEGLESPARQLQAELSQSFSSTAPGKYPARHVTATVITICLSFWATVYFLASSALA